MGTHTYHKHVFALSCLPPIQHAGDQDGLSTMPQSEVSLTPHLPALFPEIKSVRAWEEQAGRDAACLHLL